MNKKVAVVREIYERLGLKSDITSERAKFNRRMRLAADDIAKTLPSKVYENVAYAVSFRLGLGMKQFGSGLIAADFDHTILWCEAALTTLSIHDQTAFEYLEKKIRVALKESVIDLGVMFKEGKFYSAGAKELDETLLIQTLKWLEAFPVAKEGFDNALREYLKKDYPDAITKCYSALESLAKEFLHSDKSLDNLLPELLAKLSLSDQWKAILATFCKYAHEFGSRHGKRDGAKATKPNEGEVEAYIYQTGLLMRLICRARDSREEN